MRALGRTAALATTVREAVAQHERDALLLERVELAREVHESVMQRLFGVSMVLGSGRELSAADASAPRPRSRPRSASFATRSTARSSRPREPARTTLRAELDAARAPVQGGADQRLVGGRGGGARGARAARRLGARRGASQRREARRAERGADRDHQRRRRLRARGPKRRHPRRGRAPASAASACGSPPTSRCSAAGCSSSAPRPSEWRVRLVLPASDVEGFVGGGAPVAERPLQVLIVDDHAVVQWGFKVLLGRQRWVERCVVASNPEEATRRPPRASSPTSRSSTSSSASARAPSSARRSAPPRPKTRVLLISGVGWISPQAAQAAGASGFVSKDWSADEVAMAVRMVGKGMTVFGRQEEAPATPLSRARARGPGADRLRADQPRDRRAPLPLAAHGQGARQLALPQARGQEPRRGGAAGRAPRAHRAEPADVARTPRSFDRCTPRLGG